MNATGCRCAGLAVLLLVARCSGAGSELQLGYAGHAFEHLGAMGDQADAALASGANILYVTGVGSLGYQGLPAHEQLRAQQRAAAEYLGTARNRGLKIGLGYVCATSMVNLEAFDQNWTPEFRREFHSPPAQWRQQDRHGQPLPSWYGGNYQAACMNNPDWRTYERFMVQAQLEAGCDGVFFDNPTVHPQGCYCRFCMEQFVRWLASERPDRTEPLPALNSVAARRNYAAAHPQEFRQFRCTIARDFLAEMRACARRSKPGALVTANNSLNSAEVLYSQCRSYAYNIYEMSKAEDSVVVEDMSSQPRRLTSGQTIEYGPTCKLLRAISHGKPVVAIALAEADYHTPPHLVRLALAEAAANGVSHLWWPTWPEEQRQRMISLVRPEAEFLREHAALLNLARPRTEVLLFLPFRNWVKRETCQASAIAAELTRANVQYEVFCEDALPFSNGTDASGLASPKMAIESPRKDSLFNAHVILAPSLSDLTSQERQSLERLCKRGGRLLAADQPDWLPKVRAAVGQPSISIKGPRTVRATISDKPGGTLVQLFNLDLERVSSFEDRIHPAMNCRLRLRLPFSKVSACRALTCDPNGTEGPLEFSSCREAGQTYVECVLPCLEISTLLLIEGR